MIRLGVDARFSNYSDLEGYSGVPSPSLRRRPESRKSSLGAGYGFKPFCGLVFLGTGLSGDDGSESPHQV